MTSLRDAAACRLRSANGTFAFLVFLMVAPAVAAQSFEERHGPAVDALVSRALTETGAPSASIAVVENGRIVFARAYGVRSLATAEPATDEHRYHIGSASKTFTAALAAMLADEGRLSLDAPVGRLVPETTAAELITLRQALSHTAGYQGYFTMDATPAEGRRAITPADILARWAAAQLDTPPGTAWAYSNTGYTVAGVMIERATGSALNDLLQSRIFRPLGMTSAADVDQRGPGTGDAVGYTRFLLGPPRPARAIGPGWTFATGGLVMTASDLARFDVALMDGPLLSASARATMTADTRLNDGEASGYGLGLYVGEFSGKRRWTHDGSIDGFGAENRLYPDSRAAVIVLVNADFGRTPYVIADGVEALLLDPPAEVPPAPRPAPTAPPPEALPGGEAERDRAIALLNQLRAGRLDRSNLTDDVLDYFSDQVLADYRDSLAALGPTTAFIQRRRDKIGGLDASLYEVTVGGRLLIAILRLTPGGEVASFVVFPA